VSAIAVSRATIFFLRPCDTTVRLLVESSRHREKNKKLFSRSKKTGEKMIHGPRGVLEGQRIFFSSREQMQKCAKKRARQVKNPPERIFFSTKKSPRKYFFPAGQLCCCVAMLRCCGAVLAHTRDS
jgi:hypothetical protein